VMKGKPSRGMPKKATMQPGEMVNTPSYATHYCT
jgi:hypothetical protein